MRGVAVVAALLCACGGGGDPVDAAVRITVAWDGAGAEELAAAVVEPLEEAVAPIRGVRGLRSRAGDGVATVDVLVAPGELDRITNDVRTAVAGAQALLPAEAELPIVSRRQRPAAVVTAIVEPREPRYADARLHDLQVELLRTPGVARVELCGASESEVEVMLDPDRLAAHGVSIDRVARALRSGHEVTPGGQGLDWLTSVPIDERVRLGDLAQVREHVRRDCVAVTASGQGGAVVEVALRDRAARRPVVEALRRAGARIVKAPVVIGRVGIPSSVERRAQLAAQLVTAGAVAARVSNTAETIELLVTGHDAVARLQPDVQSADLRWYGVPAVEAFVTGPDAAALQRTVEEALPRLRQALGRLPSTDPPWSRPEIVLKIDRQRTAELGISPAEVAEALRVARNGEVVSEWMSGGRIGDVRLRLETRGDERLERVQVATAAGAMVRLADVTRASQARVGYVVREDRQAAVVLWVLIGHGVSADDARRAIRAALPTARFRPPSPDLDRW